MNAQPEKKESKVEAAKRRSRHLRGNIAETLASDASHFAEDDVQILKFHGMYQQDDRDLRARRRTQGLEKAYSFMIRCAIPAGVITADQYLALDKLAEEYANGTLRITSRQGLQFHGVLKNNLKTTVARINETLLTTLSACGDVSRNVMGCPAPLLDKTHVTLRKVSRKIAEQLRPASRAYHEIWLNEEKQISTEPEEPFYGDCYLPRKFKIAITAADDNCVDIYTQDVGLLAVIENEEFVGCDILVGGGMGLTHAKADTFAKLAEPLGYVEADQVVEAVRTVAAIFRDHGNRADRRHARLKYLIAEWGMDRFREEFRRRVEFDLASGRSLSPPTFHDHLGRHRQDDGKWFCGIWVENGCIRDLPDRRLRTALGVIIAEHRPGLHLTGQQNLLLTDLEETALDGIEKTLRDHGVATASKLPGARRHAMACPALPTCGLALAESERLMPSVLDRFESELDTLGLREVPITLRMTGCPNGCVRTYTADISFVGRRPDVYNVYVGGGLPGDRVVDLYAADVPTAELVNVLHPLLRRWAQERSAEESLGDFYQRLMGRREPRRSITGKEQPTQPTIAPEVSG